jgi:hypothetical protein
MDHMQMTASIGDIMVNAADLLALATCIGSSVFVLLCCRSRILLVTLHKTPSYSFGGCSAFF